MSTKNLPCITSVQWIEPKDLELFPKQFLAPGDTTLVIGYFASLKLCEPAALVTTPETTTSGIVYTTKVTGTLYDNDEQTLQHRLMAGLYAYKVQDAHKESYLIGTKEKPFPEIVFGSQIDGTPEGRRAIPFEITWVSTLPPIGIALL